MCLGCESFQCSEVGKRKHIEQRRLREPMTSEEDQACQVKKSLQGVSCKLTMSDALSMLPLISQVKICSTLTIEGRNKWHQVKMEILVSGKKSISYFPRKYPFRRLPGIYSNQNRNHDLQQWYIIPSVICCELFHDMRS